MPSIRLNTIKGVEHRRASLQNLKQKWLWVLCNSWNANKLYLLSNVFAHNLTRELQMRHKKHSRTTTVKRTALWKFTQIGTLRKRIV